MRNAANDSAQVTTRFAPSPTGLLHAGHAYSALIGFDAAQCSGGTFIVRIEDIDFTRCQRQFEIALLEDLAWLGLSWQEPVRRQSDHLSDYSSAAQRLRDQGLLYPCFCTRREVLREIEAAGGAPQGPEGPLYPGTCRAMSIDHQQSRLASGDPFALRLDLQRALEVTGSELTWHDQQRGLQRARPELLGDIVVVRRDIGCSYHLAVVIDDAQQRVTLVTRGEDLFEATHVQRLLQSLLNLPTPDYAHHSLLRDDSGRRLAKRDQAETLRALRERGVTPEQLRTQIGLGR